MQIQARYLTTAEAADYLRIKERKLYELVAAGAIPCTKVTGKWLFPRGELDRWLLSGLSRPVGLTPGEPPLIVGGSHDPLLQWALAESRVGLAILPEGSEAGWRRFLDGGVIAAAIHFHDYDQPAADANVARVVAESRLYDAVLIGFARREQGLLVADGNPHRIVSLKDAIGRSLRLAARPDGAGAQQLLLGLARSAGIEAPSLRAALVAPTGPDIAQAIRAGHADYGIATRAVATAGGVDFVPLLAENFDLLIRQRDSYRPPMQALFALMRSSLFAERARELGGLDVSGAACVRWAP